MPQSSRCWEVLLPWPLRGSRVRQESTILELLQEDLSRDTVQSCHIIAGHGVRG